MMKWKWNDEMIKNKMKWNDMNVNFDFKTLLPHKKQLECKPNNWNSQNCARNTKQHPRCVIDLRKSMINAKNHLEKKIGITKENKRKSSKLIISILRFVQS